MRLIFEEEWLIFPEEKLLFVPRSVFSEATKKDMGI
jgi:hypothetical protein